MGRRTRKSVATLAGRPPACDPARPRSARAGFGSKGRRRAAWNPAWAPRPSGQGMRPVGGCWAPAGIGDDVAAGTEAGSRAAAPRHESARTAFPCRLRPICSRGRWRRGGSPCGTATVLRSTSVGRRRTAVDGHQREGRASRAARRGGRCGKAGEGAGPAARVHGARRPAGPSRRRGHTGPEVDKREMRRAHRGRRAHPGGCRTRSFMPNSQRRPSKRNAPLSAGKPPRCPPRLFDSGRRPELGRPWSA